MLPRTVLYLAGVGRTCEKWRYDFEDSVQARLMSLGVGQDPDDMSAASADGHAHHHVVNHCNLCTPQALQEVASDLDTRFDEVPRDLLET